MREWSCKNGHVLDRDLNTAKTSQRRNKNISSEIGDYKGGEEIRLWQPSTRYETHSNSKAHPIAFDIDG
jgi:hypothetical protein